MIGLMNSGSQMSLGSYASQVSATSTVKAERRRLAVERLEETAIELRKWLRSATKSLKHELYEDAARCVALARAVDAARDTTYRQTPVGGSRGPSTSCGRCTSPRRAASSRSDTR